MRVSAKADYAVRAAVELAAAKQGPVKGEAIAEAQGIPLRFLENILAELRHAGLVQSQRGAEGGYWLARKPSEVKIADVIRAVEGPLASVRSERPEELTYEGAAEPLRDVWVALRVNIRVTPHCWVSRPRHPRHRWPDWPPRRSHRGLPRSLRRSPTQDRCPTRTERCRRG
jgi:Rrf2 family protein